MGEKILKSVTALRKRIVEEMQKVNLQVGKITPSELNLSKRSRSSIKIEANAPDVDKRQSIGR